MNTVSMGELADVIWVARGRDWGFRFLSDAGLDDPAPVWQAAFCDAESADELCRSCAIPRALLAGRAGPDKGVSVADGLGGLPPKASAGQGALAPADSVEAVALRFPDPESRLDSAGRPIVHDFVLFGDLLSVHSVADGLAVIWPLVAPIYEQLYDQVS